MEIQHFPYASLRVAACNPRVQIDPAELRQLALHVARDGLLTPLRVTPGGDILAGQRRWRAIGLVIAWRDHLVDGEDGAQPDEHALFDMRAQALIGAVPCVVDDAGAAHAPVRALAENLHHEPMSSYDTAMAYAELAGPANDPRRTMTELARETGRSKSTVSRMLTAWRQAGPELHAAWQAGLAFERVLALAALPLEAQREARAGGHKSHGRPGIEATKEMLRTLQEWPGRDPYTRGLIDALRYVTGDLPAIDITPRDGSASPPG